MIINDFYQKLGVSATKEDVHDAIKHLPPSDFPGAFCHLVRNPTDPLLTHIIHSDGAGTKSNVAYIAYKETGRVSWFESLAQDSIVMNLDDMICVGALGPFITSNTIGRNAAIISGEILKTLLQGYNRFAELLRQVGIEILLGGGETADAGDTIRTLMVDSTLYTTLQSTQVIDFSKVREGDLIIGFSSSGKATYETAENSGIGSNGFTLARHVLLDTSYRHKYPETFSPEIDANSVYCGQYLVEDNAPGTNMTIAQALLSPTRTYAPIVKKLLSDNQSSIHGLIHNTGGGATKCIRFGQGLHFIKDNLFSLPPILKLIKSEGNLDMRTMLRTFNCGHRLEVFCPEDKADDIISTGKSFGIQTQAIGKVLRSPNGRNFLTIKAGEEILEFF